MFPRPLTLLLWATTAVASNIFSPYLSFLPRWNGTHLVVNNKNGPITCSGSHWGLLARDVLLDVEKASYAGDGQRRLKAGSIFDLEGDVASNPSWRTECSVSSEFEAEIFVFPGPGPNPAAVPREIEFAYPTLKEYWRTDDGHELPYPGDFYTCFPEIGYRVMMVDYDKLPQAVRDWREKKLQEGTSEERKYIAVVGSKAFFAPGVVTWLRPLFAVKDVEQDLNECQKQLADVENFPIRNWRPNEAFLSDAMRFKRPGNGIGIRISAEKRQKVPARVEKTQDGAEEL